MTDDAPRPPAQPSRGAEYFICPRCGANSQQTWSELQIIQFDDFGEVVGGESVKDDPAGRVPGGVPMFDTRPTWGMSRCYSCHSGSVWRGSELIYPAMNTLPAAHADMPVVARQLFNEARDVAPKSPRAGAALARAALEQLLKEIRPEASGSLDERIASLHEDVGTELWAGLTVIRHLGNKALHGADGDDVVVALVLDEDTSTLDLLFEIINQLVDELLTRPRRTRALFEKLPDNVAAAALKKAGIELPDLPAPLTHTSAPIDGLADDVLESRPRNSANDLAPRLPS